MLYGNSADEAHRMASLLQMQAQLSSEQMFIYAEGIAASSRHETLPMKRLRRHEKLVPPGWLQQRIEAADSQDHRVVEVAWRKRQLYDAGHIPSLV